MASISHFFDGVSTTSPRCAFLYRRSPSTLTAEVMGTCCTTTPRKSGSTASTASRVVDTPSRESSPVRSPLSERTPNLRVHSYSLGRSTKKRASLVARPTSTTRRPVANGSRVPAWPTFLHGGAQLPAHPRDDVVRREALGLVDQQDAVERRLASSELSHAVTSSGPSSLEKPAARRWPPPPWSAAIALTSKPFERRLTRTRGPAALFLDEGRDLHTGDAAQAIDDALGLFFAGAGGGVVGELKRGHQGAAAGHRPARRRRRAPTGAALPTEPCS